MTLLSEFVVPVATLLTGLGGGYWATKGKRVDASAGVTTASVNGQNAVAVARVNAETAALEKTFARVESLEQRLDETAGRHDRERREDAARHEAARAEDAARCRQELEQFRGEIDILRNSLAEALVDRDTALARHDASSEQRAELVARCDALTMRIAQLERHTSTPGMPAVRPPAKKDTP